MRQLILATIIGIQSHPRIRKPNIFYPILQPGEEPQEVFIENWRDFGGIALEDPGLTCSVYPNHTARDTRRGRPEDGRSIKYAPYTLGGPTDATSNDIAHYQLVVELAYQDERYGEGIDFEYTEQDSLDMQLANHAYLNALNIDQYRSLEYESPFLAPDTPLPAVQSKPNSVTIRTNVGESILREYMDLIRLVLVDLPTLRPFSVRSSQLLCVDYPTSNWIRRNTDIYFHSAYLIWELTLYPPNSWKDIYFMPVKRVNISN